MSFQESQTPAPAQAPAGPPPSSPFKPLGFESRAAVDHDQWQSMADACPHATFFHTPVWFSIFARSDPSSRIAARLYSFEDGKTAIFPLIERIRLGGLYRTAEGSPGTCYGGLISAHSLAPEHVLTVTRDILKQFPNLVWRVNPLDPQTPVLDPLSVRGDSTEILDLRELRDEASLRAHYRHSVRKQINKGAKAGLRAWVSENWEEWEEYYRLYEGRLRHWGSTATNRYSLSLFRSFYEARGPKLRLSVVAKDDRIVGGNLNFYQGRHCVEWHAAYDGELFSIGVRDYLVDWIVQDARERGFAWYDFNPSGGHEGSRRFKQSFGTASFPSNVILSRRGLYRLESARHLLRFARKHRPFRGGQAPSEDRTSARV